MTHANFHELSALRLYGELSAAEERALERHLAACAECASFARELDQGLGLHVRIEEDARRTARAGQAARASELPPDWIERLRAATRPARPRRWLRPLATFAAGVAAGLLVMASLRADAHLSVPPPRAAHADDEAPFVPRSEPPPRASSRGELARIDTLVR